MSIDRFEQRLKSTISQDAAGLVEVFVDRSTWKTWAGEHYEEFSQHWSTLGGPKFAAVNDLLAIEEIAKRIGKTLQLRRSETSQSWGMLWLEDGK